jgi:hypothetical protein
MRVTLPMVHSRNPFPHSRPTVDGYLVLRQRQFLLPQNSAI